jgi:apolipoprotein N-acyltransferase
MEPGQGPPILDVGPVRAGVLICYEVAFDDVAREAVQGGAQLLLVPSNNATYVGTAQPLQQLGIERFRALEARRAVLVASTTGVSAMIEPDGAVVRSIGDGGSGWLLGRVPLSEEITPAIRFGGVVGVLVAVLTALAVLVTARPRSRKASRPTRGATRRTHREGLSS